MTTRYPCVDVVEGQVVDVAELGAGQPLQHPPAILPRCGCRKNGTAEAHGAVFDAEGQLVRAPFICAEVVAIHARVRADVARDHRRPIARLARWLRRGGA